MDEQQITPIAEEESPENVIDIRSGMKPPELFDVNKEFKDIPARTPDSKPIRVTMGFPSDEQWNERKRKTRMRHHSLGRGMSRIEILANPKTDLAIYEAVRRNGSEAIEGEEATELLNKLQKADASGEQVTWEGSGAVVLLDVVGMTVKHTFTSIPSAKQVRKANEETTLRQLPHGVVETYSSYEPGIKLWKACGGASDSYADGIIPGIHKDAAIRAVIQKHNDEVEAAFKESDDF